MTAPACGPALVAEPAGAVRRFVDRLGVRLGLVIGLALLPVGAMAVMQASDLITEARARSEAALAGETLRAVRPKLSLIKRAQGGAEVLAALGPAAGCAVLAPLVGASDFGFAGFYGTDGRALCQSGDAPRTLGGTRALAAGLSGGEPVLSVLHARAGASVLVALHPHRDAGGVLTGFAAISPRDGVSPDLEDRITTGSKGFSLYIFDRSGAVLTAGGARLLPAGRPLDELAVADVTTFTAAAEGGGERAYSLVRLVDGELYALGTWPAERRGLVALRALPPLIFPALMWGMSLVAAWLAAELLVSTHIRRLNGAIWAFSQGDRRVRPLDLRSAPREIRDAAEAFARMTDAILQDEAELEDNLREKEVLLREVHHRVKNNLQLIASIVNLQLRRTRSEEARTILRALQERMVSLAAVHDGLYQTAELSEIGVQTLFSGIIAQITRNAQVRGQDIALESHLQPVQLTLDQAVPLALLLTEALSNALKYASTADGSPPRVTVSFAVERGEALLEVANSAAEGAELDGAGTGIGTQLLHGFAKQLNGAFDRDFAGGMCQLRVWFSLLPKAEAA